MGDRNPPNAFNTHCLTPSLEHCLLTTAVVHGLHRSSVVVHSLDPKKWAELSCVYTAVGWKTSSSRSDDRIMTQNASKVAQREV